MVHTHDCTFTVSFFSLDIYIQKLNDLDLKTVKHLQNLNTISYETSLLKNMENKHFAFASSAVEIQ